MKILIIGSEGFIGSNLVSYFTAKGVTVYKCDIVKKQIDDVNYSYYDGTNFREIFSDVKYDLCINASGAANVSNSIHNPALDFSLNVSHVFNILEAIRGTQNPCKFIQFSSAAVYGNPKHLPINEIDCINPLSPYGFHKWQSEVLCEEFFKLYKIPSVILRIYSVYGVGLKKQLFWDLYNKSKTNNELIIYGTGNESRDFIYIDDLSRALDKIIKYNVFDSSIYNVANGEEIFLKNAVNYFFKYLDWNGKYVFSGEKRAGDPLNWNANIDKLRDIGYKQSVSFEDGIQKYCKWLKELK
jgi:UDP-glucose 4-epimerase